MKQIPDDSIDMVFCDLPYGTTKCSWDNVVDFEKLWEQYSRITKLNAAIVLFGQEPFSSTLRISNIKNYKYDWYWVKERPTNVMQIKKRAGKTVETLSVFYEKQCTYNPQMTKYTGKKITNKVKNGALGELLDENSKRVFEYKDTGFRYPTQILSFKRDILTSNIHPTQKPLELCKYGVITYTNPGDTVLDNCCGSGTIPLAAKLTGRNYIGIDNGVCEKKNSKYFGWKWADVSRDRIDSYNDMP